MIRAIGVPWFRREDYDRVRQMSHDEIPGTFDEWEQMAQRRFDQHLAAGMPLEKVMVDPDELAAFAAAQGAEVDGPVRAQFAALKVAEKYGRDH